MTPKPPRFKPGDLVNSRWPDLHGITVFSDLNVHNHHLRPVSWASGTAHIVPPGSVGIVITVQDVHTLRAFHSNVPEPLPHPADLTAVLLLIDNVLGWVLASNSALIPATRADNGLSTGR